MLGIFYKGVNMRAKVEIYSACGDIEQTVRAFISSSLSQKYAKGVILTINDCVDLSAIQCAIEQCREVRVKFGKYHTWVREVIKYSSGRVDKLQLHVTPFYETGPTYDYSGNLAISQLVIPPNGGNVDGLIKQLNYNWLGGDFVGNVHILYEHCRTKAYILDNESSGLGTVIPAVGAYNGSVTQHNLNLLTETAINGMGTYTLPVNLSATISSPRLIYYGLWPPVFAGGTLQYKLAVPTQLSQTNFHDSGNPFSYNYSFDNPQSLNMQVRGGNLLYPFTGTVRVDFIAFFPTNGTEIINPPINVGTGSVTFERQGRDLVAVSSGRAYKTTNDVLFSPQTNTLLYLVGGNDGFGEFMPRSPYSIRVTTLRGWRLPCERLS